MLTARAMEKMMEFYKGSMRDINHFMKVHAWASMIGRLEGLDAHTQQTLELAAIVHDIACPLCREKYGHADGAHQEQEGPALAEAFLRELDCDDEQTARVCKLVGRHHTYDGVDGLDWRILLEADFLVNAYEGNASENAIRSMLQNVFRTETGIRLLKSAYLNDR